MMSEMDDTSSKCRGPGQEILAELVGGRQHVAVVPARLTTSAARVSATDAVGIAGVVGAKHLADTRYLGGGLGHRGAVLTGNQHVHIIAELAGGGNGIQGRRAWRFSLSCSATTRTLIQITFASLRSLSTSS